MTDKTTPTPEPLDQLPDLVAAPLWVRRYEQARAAEMVGDEHTGRVRPWTPSDVIA